MAWTKRALVEMAYEEIGVSQALGYDVTAEQLALGLSRLDAVMETLNQNGYRLSYASPVEHRGGDLDDDSGIPPYAYEAVYLSLAIRIAPTIGKQISMETRKALATAMNALAMDDACPPRVKRNKDASPAGAGNRWSDDPFLPDNLSDPLSAGQPDALGEY